MSLCFLAGRPARVLSLLAALALLQACATTRPPSDDPVALAAYKEAKDPFEEFNRKVYAFNNGLRDYLLGPIVEVYRGILPSFVRAGIANFLKNLEGPVVFANDVLQGEGKRAKVTFGRFAANTTIGMAGVFDVAKDIGLPYHDEDFGQTLATAGVGEGSYVMIPFYGPSSSRDGWGLLVDIALDPLTWIYRSHDAQSLAYAQLGVDGLDTYANAVDQLDDIRKNSIDGYAALRSFYRQYRAREIRNGDPAPDLDMPDLDMPDADDAFDSFDDETGRE